MKRFWIGMVLLLVLLGVGCASSAALTGLHNGLAGDLEGAAQAVRQGDWETAQREAARAKDLWGRFRHCASAFADHAPLEEMDTLFSELEICEQARLDVDFAVVCMRLAQLSRAVAESHSLFWWNLL